MLSNLRSVRQFIGNAMLLAWLNYSFIDLKTCANDDAPETPYSLNPTALDELGDYSEIVLTSNANKYMLK